MTRLEAEEALTRATSQAGLRVRLHVLDITWRLGGWRQLTSATVPSGGRPASLTGCAPGASAFVSDREAARRELQDGYLAGRGGPDGQGCVAFRLATTIASELARVSAPDGRVDRLPLRRGRRLRRAAGRLHPVEQQQGAPPDRAARPLGHRLPYPGGWAMDRFHLRKPRRDARRARAARKTAGSSRSWRARVRLAG